MLKYLETIRLIPIAGECNHFNARTNCDACVQTRRVFCHCSSWHVDIPKPSRLDLKFLRSHPIVIYRLKKNVCSDYARLVHDRNHEAGTFQFGVSQDISKIFLEIKPSKLSSTTRSQIKTLCIRAYGFRNGVARMSKAILMRRA